MPPAGYAVVGYTLQLPERYAAAVKYVDGAFTGSLYNFTNNSGNYGISAMIILARR